MVPYLYIQTGKKERKKKERKKNTMENSAFDMQIRYIVLKNMCSLKQM